MSSFSVMLTKKGIFDIKPRYLRRICFGFHLRYMTSYSQPIINLMCNYSRFQSGVEFHTLIMI